MESVGKSGRRRKVDPPVSAPPSESDSALDALGRSAVPPRKRRLVKKPQSSTRSRSQVDRPPIQREPQDRIWTVPNVLSLARIAMVPLFLWLVLGPERDGLAIIVLIVSGVTDWLDGKIARATGQITSLGALLDPIADRLFILAVVVGLGLREVIPWWLALALPLRDVLLFGLLPFLRSRGYSALPVHFLGKAATAVLLYAFPLLLLGEASGSMASLARVFGWSFTIWGIGLYWWAGLLYVVQLRHLLKTTSRVVR